MPVVNIVNQTPLLYSYVRAGIPPQTNLQVYLFIKFILLRIILILKRKKKRFVNLWCEGNQLHYYQVPAKYTQTNFPAQEYFKKK